MKMEPFVLFVSSPLFGSYHCPGGFSFVGISAVLWSWKLEPKFTQKAPLCSPRTLRFKANPHPISACKTAFEVGKGLSVNREIVL